MVNLLDKETAAFIERQWGRKVIREKFPVTDEQFNEIVCRAFQDICMGHDRAQKPFCWRLVGQSGAGKTTQLLPALQHVLKEFNRDAVHLGVRLFANYHPYAQQIREFGGLENFRENTNAFALKLLTCVLIQLIKCHYSVLFEVTLLDPVYETCIHQFLSQEGYFCDYHGLAVPLEASEAWLERRRVLENRVVSDCSIHFFFETLNPALKALQVANIPNRFFIWDRYHREPLILKIQDPSLIQIYETSRNQNLPLLSEKDLQDSKVRYLSDFYKNNSWVG